MTFPEHMRLPVRKRTLLLIAGCVWTIAGGILLTRGMTGLFEVHSHLIIDLSCALVFGTIFYFVLFVRISSRHIHRIWLIKVDNPSFFSFFNLRSYLMMAIMIIGGITLRMLDVINHEVLFTFYITMGIPLLVSASRFFYSWWKNNPQQ